MPAPTKNGSPNQKPEIFSPRVKDHAKIGAPTIPPIALVVAMTVYKKATWLFSTLEVKNSWADWS